MSRRGQPAITITIEPWTQVVHCGLLRGELSKAVVERFRGVQIEVLPPPLAVPAG